MLSTTWVAGVTGIEPAASGVTVHYLRVMQGKLVAFVLNTAHRSPPVPIQKLEQVGTISCKVSEHRYDPATVKTLSALLYLLIRFMSFSLSSPIRVTSRFSIKSATLTLLPIAFLEQRLMNNS